MDDLMNKLEKSLNENLLKITVSNPRRSEEIKKYSIRPVLIKNCLTFQMERHTKTQVFHENLDKRQTVEKLTDILPLYKQVQIQTVTEEVTALISKKGRASIRTAAKKQTGDACRLMHNRPKHYILEEGKKVPFLQDLGVMTAEGKIVRTRYDKFRQITAFLNLSRMCCLISREKKKSPFWISDAGSPI